MNYVKDEFIDLSNLVCSKKYIIVYCTLLWSVWYIMPFLYYAKCCDECFTESVANMVELNE